MAQLKILQLCNKPPQPAVDGGCIAMNNISQGLLKQGHELTILSICTNKHPCKKDKIDQEFLKKTRFNSIFVDTEVNIIDAFSSLVTSDSYNISRFFSPDYDLKLIELLKKERFDIIHLESLFMTPYIGTIRRFSKAKIVLRSHNLEYMIWERMAEVSKNRAKKAYLKLLARQLKKYELNVFNEIDGIAAISSEDTKKYKKLGCEIPIITIPFGINLEEYVPGEINNNVNDLFHLGAMDWKPNIEGISWFLEDVWPKVLKDLPETQLYLGGRNMPNWLLEDHSTNVINEGEVPSAKEFMQKHSIMIVPLLTAGGMRVKIIEGMALGKVVISTSIGAEGIDAKNDRDLIIANTPKEFISKLKELNKDQEKFKNISLNARKLVEEEYDNEKLTKRLVDFYHQLLQHS